MSSSTPSIALIGLGPRGVSTLERMIAQLNSITDPPQQLDLHRIDDAQHGGGKVWDIAQRTQWILLRIRWVFCAFCYAKNVI
ncbi:FAD/NAD(P)-binding protein [Corynebacterium sp. ZY180755]